MTQGAGLKIAAKPRGKKRHVQVTERHAKEDFLGFVCRMPRRGYFETREVYPVLDNPQHPSVQQLQEILGKEAAASRLRWIRFHHTRCTPAG